MAGLDEPFSPVTIARQHRLGMAGQAATTVQRDHRWKRAVAIRLEQLRVQGEAGRRDADLMRRRQRRGLRGGYRESKRQENGYRLSAHPV